MSAIPETVSNPDIYAGRRPEEIPVCSVSNAAAWLSLPVSTARAWALGQRGFERVIDTADPKRALLSFRNLVELHVLSAVRREHHVPLQHVRRAVDFLREELHVAYPLADQQFFACNGELFIEHLGRVLSVSQPRQLAMREVMSAYLRRVERDRTDYPIRLFPFASKDLDAVPRIVIDPRVQFGRPCLANTGIPTSAIAQRVKAGESIAAVAADFARPPADVEEAIRFELNAA